MLYNFRDENLVQDVIVDNIYVIINDIIEQYHHLHRYEGLTVYLPSNYCKTVIGELLERIDEAVIDEHSENNLLYNDNNKIRIELWNDGVIFIENAYEDDYIKDSDSTLTYVFDSFSTSEVFTIASNENSVLVFGFIPKDANHISKEDCKQTKCSQDVCCKKQDKDVAYYVNGKCVDEDTYKKEKDNFNQEFHELEEYCDLLHFPFHFLSLIM